MTNEQVIAEAISPDRTGWAWQMSDITKGVWIKERWCPVREPDIGPHNILRVIEWANEQKWWLIEQGQALVFIPRDPGIAEMTLPRSPRTAVEYQLAELTCPELKVTTLVVVENIIKIIATVIRKETNNGGND